MPCTGMDTYPFSYVPIPKERILNMLFFSSSIKQKEPKEIAEKNLIIHLFYWNKLSETVKPFIDIVWTNSPRNLTIKDWVFI